MSNSKKMCKYCKAYFNVEDGLQIPLGFFCCYYHAKSFADLKRDQAMKRQRAKVKKAANADRRKANKNDLAWQHKQTQPTYNKMRVLEELKWFRDRQLIPTCISCGKPLGRDQWCCGHFKTRGAQSNLRYDRRNNFLQHNNRCNLNLSGDIEGTKTTRGYKKGLLERFGEDEGQKIIDYCESNTAPVKWCCHELEKFRAECNKSIRSLLLEAESI